MPSQSDTRKPTSELISLQVFALNFRTSSFRQAGFIPAIPHRSNPPKSNLFLKKQVTEK